MAYDVIRHSADNKKESAVRFIKVNSNGAVYFGNNTNQWIFNPPSGNVNGGTFAKWLANSISEKGLKTTVDEVVKATQEYLKVNNAVKHSDDEVDAEIIDDGVEILDTPYPESGKARIPKRCFIYDDEDGYPTDYFEHSDIMSTKLSEI